MTLEIRFSKTADADLDRIWNYIAEHDNNAADRLIDRLRAATARLADYPRSAPIRIRRLRELRGLSAHGHVLLYAVDGQFVTIARVFDTRRNWPALLVQ